VAKTRSSPLSNSHLFPSLRNVVSTHKIQPSSLFLSVRMKIRLGVLAMIAQLISFGFG
jgi:hypothetical protein